MCPFVQTFGGVRKAREGSRGCGGPTSGCLAGWPHLRTLLLPGNGSICFSVQGIRCPAFHRPVGFFSPRVVVEKCRQTGSALGRLSINEQYLTVVQPLTV